MSKKVIIFFIGVIFFSGFNFAHASLIFTEVMYYPSDSDTTGEWIELYNNGSSDILIKSDKDSYGINAWRFKKGLTTEYYINSPDFTISAGEYIVLADNSSLFNNVLYKVIDSSVSLSNTNVTGLAILDETKAVVATLEYTPSVDSQNTGKSLQLINGSWIAAMPTPGQANETITPPPPPALDYNGSSSSTANTESSSTNSSQNNDNTLSSLPEPTLKAKITVKTVSFAGIPLSFESTVFGYADEKLYFGKYFWNFGDGSFAEMVNNANISHTYLYPGDYSVSLEYYLNPYSLIPDVVNKLKIKVAPLEIFISKVGDIEDFYIELTNASPHDINVSLWQLSSLNKIFTLPRNSNIFAKNKITLSSLTTGFNSEDKNDLKLLSPLGKIISEFDENASIKPSPTSMLPKTEKSKVIAPAKLETDLTSSAINADIIPDNSSNLYIFLIILLVFVSLGGGAVYFIRRKNSPAPAGSDFELLDE